MAETYTLYEYEPISDMERADRAIYELFDVCHENNRSLIVIVESEGGGHEMACSQQMSERDIVFALERAKHNLLQNVGQLDD